MKKSIIALLTAAVLLAATTPLLAGNGYGGGALFANGCGQIVADHVASLPVEELSEAERASLVKMRQEEKLARDVYLSLQLQWGERIFANIARAEQRHMDMVTLLLDRYGIEDPAADDTIGVFTDGAFNELYTQLVEAGNVSIEEALQVGATIEDLDIFDLDEALKNDIDNADIAMIYQNLAKGSRNHMRAFASRLAAYGIPYSPQYISEEAYEQITGSEWERGTILDENGEVLATCGNPGGNGQGNRGSAQGGNGNGNGRGGQGNGVCDGTGPKA
ncbi:MAG: DUF2202 domain-containing protein [Acidobacteria bacterium]|nr:DUF2202 domain-containing protein [Acidobacteriota bacterium]